jgi:hypothetical protein
MPIALANLLEEEVAEASRASGIEPFYDPCISGCTVICLFMDWYSSVRCTCPPSCVIHHCFDSGLRLGRRIPQGLRLGNEQVEKSKAFCHACETLYPGRDFSGVIKYHKLAHHVYRVAPLAGNMRSTRSCMSSQTGRRSGLLPTARIGEGWSSRSFAESARPWLLTMHGGQHP